MHDALRLYSEQGFGIRLFVRLRHVLSPLEMLESWVPREGNILDLGCGHGLFTNYMALKEPSRNIVGVDPSQGKIKVAQQTQSEVPNVHYLVGDINDVSKDSPFDAITIVDVLYLLPEAEQREVLRVCRQLLSDSGVLVLKTQDTSPRWRYLWTYLQESIVVRTGLTLGNGLHFMSVSKARQILKETGFRMEYYRLPSRILYSNVAFVCYKREHSD